LPADLQWIAPVGRLDQASEGLLLLTNDSEWAARITDPASHLDKSYHVQIDTVVNDQLLEALQRGIEIPKGVTGSKPNALPCCAPERRIPGWKSCSTKAKIDTFGACWTPLVCKSCA